MLSEHLIAAHQASDGNLAAQQVCKFHINGGCQKGDACPYLHVSLAAAPRVRQAWVAER